MVVKIENLIIQGNYCLPYKKFPWFYSAKLEGVLDVIYTLLVTYSGCEIQIMLSMLACEFVLLGVTVVIMLSFTGYGC